MAGSVLALSIMQQGCLGSWRSGTEHGGLLYRAACPRFYGALELSMTGCSYVRAVAGCLLAATATARYFVRALHTRCRAACVLVAWVVLACALLTKHCLGGWQPSYTIAALFGLQVLLVSGCKPCLGHAVVCWVHLVVCMSREPFSSMFSWVSLHVHHLMVVGMVLAGAVRCCWLAFEPTRALCCCSAAMRQQSTPWEHLCVSLDCFSACNVRTAAV